MATSSGDLGNVLVVSAPDKERPQQIQWKHTPVRMRDDMIRIPRVKIEE
jgi:hypothetical protein